MAKKTVTIFIRDTNIHLLITKGMRVQKWASLPLEPGLVTQGVIHDEDRVATRIRELFKIEKEPTGKVIAGLSGLNSLYRLITLPELPGAILDEAVKHEAGRVMPVSLDEVYLAYQSVPAPRGEMRVFLAAYPRNGADALIRTLHKAGLDPYLIDLAPLALCRIPNEPRAIIVNARAEHLTIMVMTERLPQLIRWLQLPGEAESLSEKLPAFTEELSRTVTFYNSSHLEAPLDSSVPVFVCGELAEAPEVWPSLVGRLNYTVSALPSPMEYTEDFPANEFMVNIGLALKELLLENEEANYSIVNLNILPEVYLPKAFPLSQILVPVAIAAGIAVLAFMGLRLQSSIADSNALSDQLNIIRGTIAQQIQDTAELREQVKKVQNQLGPIKTNIENTEATTGVFKTTLASLEKERVQVDVDLGRMVNLLPPAVDISNVNHGGGSITISGVASTEDAIFQYARSLRGAGEGYTVIIQSINHDEESGDYSFNFLIK